MQSSVKSNPIKFGTFFRKAWQRWEPTLIFRARFCALCVLFSSFLSVPALADISDNPPPIPGWTHPIAGSTRASQDDHGIVLPGGDVTYSSPALADIDGDPANGLETAVGGADGILYVYRADGSLLWSVNLPNKECAQSGSTNKLLSSPAVGKLFGDGVPYVVVGYGGIGGRACDGGVAVYRGPDGGAAWIFSLKLFAKREKFWSFSPTVFSSPALADTDGDGKMEIGFGSFDRNVYLLNANGTVRWYYNAADTIWSSPAFANVDKDPDLEMIIGTDISANSRIRPITKNGGYVYAFKTKARKRKLINFRQRDAFVWQTYLDQVVYSSPVIADVLATSPGPEVIVGSGCFFPQSSNDKGGKWIKVMSLKTGAVLQTLITNACLSSAVAVGDLDEDGTLEIVATVNGSTQVGGDGYSRVSAWKASSPIPFWSMIPLERGRNDSFGGTFMSPVVADVDGNGSLEVLVANSASVSILEGRSGRQLTCDSGDCSDNPFTLYAGASLRATPAVADINLDGVLDVVIASGRRNGHGMLFGWTDLAGLLGSTAGAHPAYSAPWPMARGNAQHTALFR